MKRLLLLFVIASVSGKASATSLSSQPTNQTVGIGQNVAVSINVANVADLFAFQLDLAFNPSVFSATSVSEGGFLTLGGTTSFLAGAIDNGSGTIDFNADSLIGAIAGMSGSGTLLTFNFTAIGAGTSQFSLANVTLLDSTFSAIPQNTTNGSATVQGTAVTPEPGSIVFLGSGLCALSFILFRRNRQDRNCSYSDHSHLA